VRRRDDLFEPKQRKIRIAQRFVLEYINRGVAGSACAKRKFCNSPPHRV
jgi:hypothetical protein